MSQGSAAGMKQLNLDHVSMQVQSLCKEGKRKSSRVFDIERCEDRDRDTRLKQMASKAGFLPLGVVDDAIRDGEQLQEIHDLYELFDRISEEIRQHCGGAK